MDRFASAFKKWSGRSKNNKIQAVCKPCWELKYCPYGVIVEQFDISEDNNYACRIFGHECPVFTIAEPYTETIKLRNVDRRIPRDVTLKVFRRDNQVCQLCHRFIPINELHYDHIIPWSKGGSSNEDNIRLLCSKCNLERNNKFESELIVQSVSDHRNAIPEVNIDLFKDVLRLTLLYINLRDNTDKEILSDRFLDTIKSEDKETDLFVLSQIKMIVELIEGDFSGSKIKSNVLKYRWGFSLDRKSHSIIETCDKFQVKTEYVSKAEELLFERIGFKLVIKQKEIEKYNKIKVSDQFEEKIKTALTKAQ